MSIAYSCLMFLFKVSLVEFRTFINKLISICRIIKRISSFNLTIYFRVYGNETMHGNVSFTHACSGQGKLNKR